MYICVLETAQQGALSQQPSKQSHHLEQKTLHRGQPWPSTEKPQEEAGRGQVQKSDGKVAWWLTPVIPDTQEAEIVRIMAPGQPWPKVSETPSQPIAGRHGAHLSPDIQEA
jgi:hypothetical protein